METASNILVVVDAGHGGWDNGAQYGDRREKDDNLRLALEVEKQLLAQGVQVLMTRSTDIFVPLTERAEIANLNDADLFISLHRNSYIEQTPWTNGVENFIYLTAPIESTGLAAALVLEEIEKVGVQRIVGVSRGNYLVLRRTRMPAMLLEMGYINNEIDNMLFDTNLYGYAQAIARAVMRYYSLPFDEEAAKNAGQKPPSGNESIILAQRLLNNRYGLSIPLTGRYDDATKRGGIRALQIELNIAYNSGLVVDGILGPRTLAAIIPYGMGARGGLTVLLQILLILNGYDPGPPDGVFGVRTAEALQRFQSDSGLSPDGVAGPLTFAALLGQAA